MDGTDKSARFIIYSCAVVQDRDRHVAGRTVTRRITLAGVVQDMASFQTSTAMLVYYGQSHTPEAPHCTPKPQRRHVSPGHTDGAGFLPLGRGRMRLSVDVYY